MNLLSWEFVSSINYQVSSRLKGTSTKNVKLCVRQTDFLGKMMNLELKSKNSYLNVS